MSNRDSQMSHLIARAQMRVEEKGTSPNTLEDRDYLLLASFGWLRHEVQAALAWPLWVIALGLVGNGALQTVKWLLG